MDGSVTSLLRAYAEIMAHRPPDKMPTDRLTDIRVHGQAGRTPALQQKNHNILRKKHNI